MTCQIPMPNDSIFYTLRLRDAALCCNNILGIFEAIKRIPVLFLVPDLLALGLLEGKLHEDGWLLVT
eukprot:scaffold14975_cov132-Skeletonema_menzelii.AAC.1